MNDDCYFIPGSQISYNLILMARTLITPCEMMVMSLELVILYNQKIFEVERVPPLKWSMVG